MLEGRSLPRYWFTSPSHSTVEKMVKRLLSGGKPGALHCLYLAVRYDRYDTGIVRWIWWWWVTIAFIIAAAYKQSTGIGTLNETFHPSPRRLYPHHPQSTSYEYMVMNS